MAKSGHIVEASIDDLATLLSSGQLTSVDLLARCLLRISAYDCRNTLLNSIPLLNENVFAEAEASDDRRKTGQAVGLLDGVPFTVKDSYKVKGMTVASGSEAFESLVANEDAFMVGALRKAGAVLVGKTNMCPMAYGGMLRGVYGRAENPYNRDYLAAAFGSGSSNGSGVSTAASFASFGLGGETVSSGRSPASNNALVVYTPSKGLISLRGSWPLYPTCDVLIPHTRSVDDLLSLLDILATEDSVTTGDFWRDQPYINVPKAWPSPPPPFYTIKDDQYLKGKHIAVPKLYMQQCEGGPLVSPAVTTLFRRAKSDLEAAGATVTIVDTFPAVQAYDAAITQSSPSSTTPPLPPSWNSTERGALIANGWEDFLQSTQSPTHPSLTAINPTSMFPHFPRTNPQVKFTEPANAVQWSNLASYIASRPKTSQLHPGKSPIYDVPHLEQACMALESLRKTYFDTWLTEHNFDFVAFPAAGDVARADADVDEDSARHAWADGVKYSHGNRALRHLGIPSVTVPMGLLEGSGMPMGLTFLGAAYKDIEILKIAAAYEAVTRRRVAPGLTPVLESDYIRGSGIARGDERERPMLEVVKCTATKDTSTNADGLTRVFVEGTITTETETNSLILDVYIDGQLVPVSKIQISAPAKSTSGTYSTSTFSCTMSTASPPVPDERNRVIGKIARDSTMIMILARDGQAGWPAGYLKLVHSSEQ